MKKGRSLKQSLGLLCGLIAAACAVLYSITLVYVLETAENKLMASVMDDMLQTVVTADILQGKPPRLDQVTRLYIEGDPTRQIPELFKNYPQGYTEFTDGEDTETYQYDDFGQMTSYTKNDGTTIDYSYDALGRKLSEGTSGHPRFSTCCVRTTS